MRRLADHRLVLERVIGDAAHQLRTPIASVVSQTEMLSTQSDETLRAAHVVRLRELSLNLAQLVNQLINHAMVQHRAMNPEFSDIDLAELVRREVATILSDSATRDLDIELRVPEGDCKVRGDPTTLAESIKNVTHNALQYGAPGLFHVEIQDAGDDWRLRFEDDGAGIDAAQQERLRQPFAARPGGRVGASLGLSIVERVMQAHGGSLRFARTDNAHFVVELVLPKLY
jgi:two-component system sensor histidine kinase TctE